MKILVCIKQVPDVTALRLDPETHRLVRDGVASFVNPFDQRALALAAGLRDESGAEFVVATMGLPQARDILTAAYAIGADRCILVSDPALAGSDTMVTARVLSRLAMRETPDLVFMGQYSIDSETSQVPEETAAILGWPCLPAVREFALDSGGAARVACETDIGTETVRAPLPLVLSTAERLIKPLRTPPEALEAARDRAIETLGISDLGLAADDVGAAGSPTRVTGIHPVASNRSPTIVDEGSPRERAELCVRLLGATGALDSAAAPSANDGAPWPETAASTGRPVEVWALADIADGAPRQAAAEHIGLAKTLAAPSGGSAVALLLGPPGIESLAPATAAAGADRVLVGVSDRLDPFTSEAWSSALLSLLDGGPPDLVIGAATRVGRGVLSRTAAALGLGLTGDCIGIEWDAEGRLSHLKPAFGGNVVAPIECRTRPELSTVVPGMVRPLEPRPGREVPVEVRRLDVVAPRVEVEDHEPSARGEIDALDQAELVLCLGSVISGPDDMDRIREALPALEQATGLKGALAATRRVTDEGWLPRQTQVGLTGRAIRPRLYIGVGVRGAPNHVCGIRHAGTIVALNRDPKAPIFENVDIGLVGNWRELLPALVDALSDTAS
jgi:electron transfer flavoprotein alpha subunit